MRTRGSKNQKILRTSNMPPSLALPRSAGVFAVFRIFSAHYPQQKLLQNADANTMQPLTYSTRNLYAKIAASMYHGHGGFAEFVLDIS